MKHWNILVAVILVAAPSLARADDAPSDVSTNLLGFVGFLRLDVAHYSLGYQRVFAGRHGLTVGATIGHFHDPSEGNEIHLTTFGGALGYRYHWGGARGPFLGLTGGYRMGSGRREATERVDIDVDQIFAVPHVGYRWLVPSLRLCITGSAGAGYGPYSASAVGTGAMADEAEAYTESALSPTPIVTEFELSLGYAF